MRDTRKTTRRFGLLTRVRTETVQAVTIKKEPRYPEATGV